MVYLKVSDVRKAERVWDDVEGQVLPRQFMLDMFEEYGTAYWISGCLFWIMKCVKVKSCSLDRFLKVQKKMISLGYSFIEDIHDEYDVIRGQVNQDYNSSFKAKTDLRHARYIRGDKLVAWTKKEKRKAKEGAEAFNMSKETDLTKFCRANKKHGWRELQLLVYHFVTEGV